MRRTRVLAFAVLGGVGAKSRSVVGEADSDKTKAKWAQPRQHRSDLRPWPRTVPLCVANSPARGTESSQQRAAIQMRRRGRPSGMEARKRELVYRACVSDEFPWNATRATPQAPESTKIAHLAASFRRARHGSATPNPLLRGKKNEHNRHNRTQPTPPLQTKARKERRVCGRLVTSRTGRSEPPSRLASRFHSKPVHNQTTCGPATGLCEQFILGPRRRPARNAPQISKREEGKGPHRSISTLSAGSGQEMR